MHPTSEHPTCRPCWHKAGVTPGKNGCVHEEAPPNSAALELCWFQSFLEGSWWGLRGTPWFLPPASAGRYWGSDPASAPLSAWTQGSHCRLPWDTCLDQPCLSRADRTLSFVSKSFSIYLLVLWRESGLKTSECKYNAMLVMPDHRGYPYLFAEAFLSYLGPTEWFRVIPWHHFHRYIEQSAHVHRQSQGSRTNGHTQIKLTCCYLQYRRR